MDNDKIYLTIQILYKNKAYKLISDNNFSYEELLKKAIDRFSIDKRDIKYIEVSYLDKDNEKILLNKNDNDLFKYSQEISKNQFLLKLDLELVYYNSVYIDPKELNNSLDDKNDLSNEKDNDLSKKEEGIKDKEDLTNFNIGNENDWINKLKNELILEKQKSEKYEKILKNYQKQYEEENNSIKSSILKLFNTKKNLPFCSGINNCNDDKINKKLLKIAKENDFVILNNNEKDINKINKNSRILNINEDLENLINKFHFFLSN